jgi:hypothetical protein
MPQLLNHTVKPLLHLPAESFDPRTAHAQLIRNLGHRQRRRIRVHGPLRLLEHALRHSHIATRKGVAGAPTRRASPAHVHAAQRGRSLRLGRSQAVATGAPAKRCHLFGAVDLREEARERILSPRPVAGRAQQRIPAKLAELANRAKR